MHVHNYNTEGWSSISVICAREDNAAEIDTMMHGIQCLVLLRHTVIVYSIHILICICIYICIHVYINCVHSSMRIDRLRRYARIFV